jgi:hypothetical protein
MKRRTFLKVLGGAAAAGVASAPFLRALADPPSGQNEFFIFIHASGGWDVTLWSDPRNERVGLVEPASTDNTDFTVIRRYASAPLDADSQTFQLVRPSGSNITFGPTIGDLGDHYDRICLINGIAMNTVSHPDGTAFSATGRHLAGGRVPASSIDTMVANEFGTGQLFPVVSVNFPSSFVGNLDRRAMPLRVGAIGSIAKSLTRSNSFDNAYDRDQVTALLSREAEDLAQISYYPDALHGMSVQIDNLRRMLPATPMAMGLQDIFSATRLQTAHPEFNYRARFQSTTAINAAFAVEAMERNIVRAVAFAAPSFDTHNANYKQHAQNQQELFDLIATLLRTLDTTAHPNLTGEMLAAHTHIMVFSDFCRTPQVNLALGRDHYPNNSTLIISPRFRSNFVYGSTDHEQVLPEDSGMFSDGMRPIAPPDVLATFLQAFGVDYRPYLRDGEAVPALLRT